MKITFLGGGNMANALVSGLLQQQTSPDDITVIETDATARERLASAHGIHCQTDCTAAPLPEDGLLVLAVKPQQMKAAIAPLAGQLSRQIVVSIAAGLRLETLSRWLGGYRRIVRAMPNTPSMIGAGITGLCAFPEVLPAERQAAERILQAVGSTLWLASEGGMDALTAISGSGPAYVFLFMEALQEAASELGFSSEEARQLALQTFSGAARLAAASGEEVSLLRQRVTSKGGTTEAALRTMQAAGIRESIIAGTRAARARSLELGHQLDQEG